MQQEVIGDNIHVSLVFPPDTETPGLTEGMEFVWDKVMVCYDILASLAWANLVEFILDSKIWHLIDVQTQFRLLSYKPCTRDRVGFYITMAFS